MSFDFVAMLCCALGLVEENMSNICSKILLAFLQLGLVLINFCCLVSRFEKLIEHHKEEWILHVGEIDDELGVASLEEEKESRVNDVKDKLRQLHQRDVFLPEEKSLVLWPQGRESVVGVHAGVY